MAIDFIKTPSAQPKRLKKVGYDFFKPSKEEKESNVPLPETVSQMPKSIKELEDEIEKERKALAKDKAEFAKEKKVIRRRKKVNESS